MATAEELLHDYRVLCNVREHLSPAWQKAYYAELEKLWKSRRADPDGQNAFRIDYLPGDYQQAVRAIFHTMHVGECASEATAEEMLEKAG